MSGLLTELLPLLCCPDDAGELSFGNADTLCCSICGREYPLSVDEREVSLVSSRMSELEDGASRSYLASYRQARASTCGGENWRLEPDPRSQGRKQSQVAQVAQLLDTGGARDLLCDFSAGPGYYTLHFAAQWGRVIHCDLSAVALRAAREEATARGLDNILFVRMDYLNPPFRETLPQVICMDSLIRGPRHERALLGAIRRSLAPSGTAVVDFHNWWHNPLRRLGLMPQNFADNRSYAARELTPLLAAAGITQYERFRFHQELATMSRGIWRAVAAVALPPTRWVYRFSS